MKSVAASKAKTHFSDLLDRVARGEKLIITRHGVPAAMLVPVIGTAPQLSHQDIVERMSALRKRVKPGRMRGRERAVEGRRVRI
jgi:prevent-host-death family protein